MATTLLHDPDEDDADRIQHDGASEHVLESVPLKNAPESTGIASRKAANARESQSPSGSRGTQEAQRPSERSPGRYYCYRHRDDDDGQFQPPPPFAQMAAPIRREVERDQKLQGTPPKLTIQRRRERRATGRICRCSRPESRPRQTAAGAPRAWAPPIALLVVVRATVFNRTRSNRTGKNSTSPDGVGVTTTIGPVDNGAPGGIERPSKRDTRDRSNHAHGERDNRAPELSLARASVPLPLHDVGAMIRAIAHPRTSASNEKTGSTSRLPSTRSVMSAACWWQALASSSALASAPACSSASASECSTLQSASRSRFRRSQRPYRCQRGCSRAWSSRRWTGSSTSSSRPCRYRRVASGPGTRLKRHAAVAGGGEGERGEQAAGRDRLTGKARARVHSSGCRLAGCTKDVRRIASSR